MLKLKELNKKKNRGFTLIETIITLVLLCVISLVCVGILTSMLSARNDLEVKLKDQIALRQTVLTVTSEIRKDPDDTSLLGPVDKRYDAEDGMLRRTADGWGDMKGSAVAFDIADFDISIADGRAEIYIKSIGGQVVTTQIYLRF